MSLGGKNGILLRSLILCQKSVLGVKQTGRLGGGSLLTPKWTSLLYSPTKIDCAQDKKRNAECSQAKGKTAEYRKVTALVLCLL